MNSPRPTALSRMQALLSETFGVDRKVLVATLLFSAVAIGFATFWFLHSAPPGVIVITSGPKDSLFYRNAQKYAEILGRNHVKARILPSEGSLENLKRLADPKSPADVGFVQGGTANGIDLSKISSLGSINHQPLMIFHRGTKPLAYLSELSGKRIAVGPEGSGTRFLALDLLAANGIKPGGSTSLEGIDAEEATKALLAGKVDAVFLMGDSAPMNAVRELLHTPGIRLYSFVQADAYVRRFNYLNKMTLPEGALDFGRNIPPHDVQLIGPTVELVAKSGFDPALTDLMLEAAKEVHGGSSIFKKQGEFPAPQEHEFQMNSEALRFYKSGKSFFYRSLPFWLASLVDRVIVVFVPLLVILIPGLRAIPAALRWRMNMVIYRWYRILLRLEQDVIANLSPENREEYMARLDRIEREVNTMKVSAPYATQFYELRGHINFVRSQLNAGVAAH